MSDFGSQAPVHLLMLLVGT